MAQRVGRSIALLFHGRGTRRGWVVSSTPRPHFTPGKDPVPVVQEAGWAPGPVWMDRKSRPHQDSIPDRPAHSQCSNIHHSVISVLLLAWLYYSWPVCSSVLYNKVSILSGWFKFWTILQDYHLLFPVPSELLLFYGPVVKNIYLSSLCVARWKWFCASNDLTLLIITRSVRTFATLHNGESAILVHCSCYDFNHVFSYTNLVVCCCLIN